MSNRRGTRSDRPIPPPREGKDFFYYTLGLPRPEPARWVFPTPGTPNTLNMDRIKYGPAPQLDKVIELDPFNQDRNKIVLSFGIEGNRDHFRESPNTLEHAHCVKLNLSLEDFQ